MPDDYEQVMGQAAGFLKMLEEDLLKDQQWRDVTDSVMAEAGAKSYMLNTDKFCITVASFPLDGVTAYRAMAMSRDGLALVVPPPLVESVFKKIEAK